MKAVLKRAAFFVLNIFRQAIAQNGSESEIGL